MRVLSSALATALITGVTVLALAACGSHKNGSGDDTTGDSGVVPDPCVGLECQVAKCAEQGKPPTTIVGTVYAPNGTLPLFGINVYVPRDPVAPFTDGAQCSRCSDELSGSPIARVQSDDMGNFRLENVPSGDNIPLVITTGKWRRQITIPKVAECADTTLTAQDTRLPKNKAEGDLPKIALTTGGADSLECLVRKLGIADSEVTTDAGAGRVHFFAGSGLNVVTSFSGGGNFPNATTLWSTVDKLKQYDIVFLSCEGAQNAGTKPQATLDAMKAYADLGGRVFASHWHNIWIGGNFTGGGTPRPAVWNTIAQWRAADGNPGNPVLIDEASNPKGNAFASWMVNVKGTGPAAQTGGSVDTVRDQIAITTGTGRATSTALDTTKAERWVYTGAATGNTPQMFQFTTPNEQPLEARCGKVVFTDMHVSGNPGTGGYPNACPGTTLSPQEKALAFMFFDIASCIGPIF